LGGVGRAATTENLWENAMIERRDILKLALGSAAAAFAAPAVAETAVKPRTKIVFLGTKGGPRVGIGASNSANLVMVNDTPIVIDCGMGVSRQLVSAGVPIPSLKYIFISHHHSDHNLEYGNLFYNAWAAGLSTPIHSFGPVGIEAMTRAYWELNKFDVETRIEDEGRPDPRPLLIAKDITEDGVVLQTADVKVTAFRTRTRRSRIISPTNSRRRMAPSCSPATPHIIRNSRNSLKAPTCWCTSASTCPRSIAWCSKPKTAPR
jgi:hypothetical protein